MILETAKEIASLRCAIHPKQIEAIRILRAETHMSLIEAKLYLDAWSIAGEDALLKKLCEDYVQDPRELLVRALAEMARLQRHIEHLENLIADEEGSYANSHS